MKIDELKAAIDGINNQLDTLSQVVSHIKLQVTDPDVPQEVVDGIAKVNDAINKIIAG